MNRKQPWLDWLAQSDDVVAAAWMEAWRIDGRSHAETDLVPRRMRREIELLHFALIDLVANDPVRALDVAFIVARTADHPGMIAEVAVSLIQDVTTTDPTLWDAIAIEAAANPRLLHAIGLVWGANVPDQLRDGFRRLALADDAAEGRPLAGGSRFDGSAMQPRAAGP